MKGRSIAELVSRAGTLPFSRFLGMEVFERDGDLLARMRYAPHLIGNAVLPALHGGALGALLESIAIFAVLVDAQNPHTPKTISFTVDYLRSAKSVDTLARAEVVRQGRRVATVRSFAWQEDPAKPVATANVQLLLSA